MARLPLETKGDALTGFTRGGEVLHLLPGSQGMSWTMLLKMLLLQTWRQEFGFFTSEPTLESHCRFLKLYIHTPQGTSFPLLSMGHLPLRAILTDTEFTLLLPVSQSQMEGGKQKDRGVKKREKGRKGKMGVGLTEGWDEGRAGPLTRPAILHHWASSDGWIGAHPNNRNDLGH